MKHLRQGNKEEGKRFVIFKVFLIIGLSSIAYFLYDLKYPDHFVGDMYGLEVMVRAFILLAASLPMIIGLGLRVIGRKRNSNHLITAGFAMVILSSSILLYMAIGVSGSRNKDEMRKTYAHKSIDELLKIAREQKDEYAIYAIMEKKDPAAVLPLCEILLDEKADVKLRMESAHALGEIDGEGARKALAKALGQSKNQYLTRSINYALEAIDRRENKKAEKTVVLDGEVHSEGK
jgi:ABC-type antimicrobial peptide transport system permease subunit